VKYHLGPVSGRNKKDCSYLLYRYRGDQYSPERGDICLLQAKDDQIHHLLTFRGWLYGIWVSPRGRTFIADAARRVHYNPVAEPRGAPWQVLPVPAVVTGVWGLDDDHVFAWGVAAHVPVLFQLRDGQFAAIDCPGEIVSMHGSAPDRIYAVGHEGLIARWDGAQWSREASPLRGTLVGIHVTPEAVYASGRGVIVRDDRSWRLAFEHATPLHAIARWRERVWIAAGAQGLGEMIDDQIVIVKGNIPAERLEVHDDLLIGAPTAIVSTSDGARFFGSMADHIAKVPAG
jgi:hypothetical protein